MNTLYDYLIVGSGLFGATFARMVSDKGRRCLVIERRPHLGGNVYCQEVEGINTHRYGAHVFHTSDKEIWDFVTSFVVMNRYTNSPMANYRGRLYNLPFNMNTFYALWGVTTPARARERIEAQRNIERERLVGQGVLEPRNLEEQALLLVGRDVYDTLIKGYTQKQWGRPCNELPAFIIKRLPLRLVFDNNYFNDTYQGIPVGGYNRLIGGLLKGVETRTDTDFFDNRPYFESVAAKIIYTGPIDRYFDFSLGRLEYRTLRFDTRTLPMANYQGNAVVNYTDQEVPYTRVIEHKHFEAFGPDVYANPHTVVSYEYPAEHKPGMEPYYPVNNRANNALYARYKALADNLPHVIFGGRLAEYKYYDMAPVIKQAVKTAAVELAAGNKQDLINPGM